MRVLLAHNAYQQRGGEDSVVDSEIALLRAHGHAVETYTRSNDELIGMSTVSLARQTLWSGRTFRDVADLITVDTLEYRKNQRYAPDIVHAAKQQGHHLTLTVVGDGPDRAMLEARAAELGIDGQVRFVGFVANAAARMPAHRACLHVAHMENLPLTLIEALSRGLPVFAPRVGGMPEVFEDGIQGSLIPLDDAAQAARLIVHWLDDAARMAEVRSLARRRFLDRFEASRVAARLADFLDDPNQRDARDSLSRGGDVMYQLGKNTC